MYIPVAEDGEGYYSEGSVVRFIRKDGTDWVANFKPGWTDLSFVKEFREYNRVLVIANGQGYLLKGNTLYGKSYHPTSDADEWIDFSIDLETKTVKGGSFGQTTNSNGKTWWKIWK